MGVDLLGLCLMPNRWHIVLRQKTDKDLAVFMRWLSTAHVRRHHAHYRRGLCFCRPARKHTLPPHFVLKFLNLSGYAVANICTWLASIWARAYTAASRSQEPTTVPWRSSGVCVGSKSSSTGHQTAW